MTDNPTKLISVAFYNRQNQIFITGNFYHFNGALSKSNKRYIYSNNPPNNYSFSYFYDHDWRPTHTTLTVGGITQQINAMQYNVCLIATLSVLSLDRKYQRSLYESRGLPALNNQRKSKQGCVKCHALARK